MNIDEIFELRQRVNDPAGYPIFVDGPVPALSDEQTAYRTAESKYYNNEEERLAIIVSDSRIDGWITSYGIDVAEIKALEAIIANLGAQINLESMGTGAESMKFVTLSSRYSYYKSILDDKKKDIKQAKGCTFGSTTQAVVGGGDV